MSDILSCNYCGKDGFSRQDSLNRHKRNCGASEHKEATNRRSSAVVLTVSEETVALLPEDPYAMECF